MIDLDHISHNSVSTYHLCPHAWKLHYIDKVKVPKANDMEMLA